MKILITTDRYKNSVNGAAASVKNLLKVLCETYCSYNTFEEFEKHLSYLPTEDTKSALNF